MCDHLRSFSQACPYTHEDPLVDIEGVSGKFDKLNIPRIPSQNVTECSSHGSGVQNMPVTADLLLCFESAAGQQTFDNLLRPKGVIYDPNVTPKGDYGSQGFCTQFQPFFIKLIFQEEPVILTITTPERPTLNICVMPCWTRVTRIF